MDAVVQGIQAIGGYIYHAGEVTAQGIGNVGSAVVDGTVAVLKAIFMGA